MKKICIFLITFIIFINIFTLIYKYSDYNIDIFKIQLIKYDINNDVINIKIVKNKDFFNKKFICVLYDNDTKQEFIGENKECNLNVKNSNYNIYIEGLNGGKSKTYRLNEEVENVLNFNFKYDTIYLALDEEKSIEYDDILIDKNFDYEFKSKNEEIAKIKGNKIIAINSGETEIYSNKVDKTLKVIVTDIITKPTLSTKRKELIPCNKYTDTENKLLDDIMSYKINSVGYSTRASVVEAARFLTLEFKYRIPYFYENGRMYDSDLSLVDGEGRYYKKGLYLSESKKDSISNKLKGPVIWGCPLMNLTEDKNFGYIIGNKKPNGLDCSGFVAWVLKNGGFDPGDIGAGETPNPNQMTDLGKYTKLTMDLIKENKIKAGDLLNFWGHIAIIIGVDNNYYYVAESLPEYGGVVAKKYLKNNINSVFPYVVLMDDYYKNEGNYTEMWY